MFILCYMNTPGFQETSLKFIAKTCALNTKMKHEIKIYFIKHIKTLCYLTIALEDTIITDNSFPHIIKSYSVQLAHN